MQLPYHYRWKPTYQIDLGLRVHWFGRYAGYAKWSVATSRLASDMVMFFFVEKQKCSAIVNGRKIDLKRGDLLVISGADEFSFSQNPAKPHSSLSTCLTMQHGGAANALLQRKFERRYALRNVSQYIVEFEKVLGALASHSNYRDLKIAGALFQWIDYLMSEIRPPLDRSFLHERSVVDKILTAEAWGNSRLKQVVTLTEWAKAIGLNPIYFGRIFKRETGQRPMEWLNQRRLQMASQYLSSTETSVAEIADACGFADQFYFSRVFHRHFGMPPLKYRRRRS
jgi:AraC-like DNA-binding protein